MKKLLLAASASLALAFAAVPAAAQDDAIDEEAFAQVQEELSEAFEVEPLTPEQEARLPLAREIMAVALPEGAMRTAMEGMFGGAFGELAMEAEVDPNSALTEAFGYYFYFELEPEQAEQALAIIDPDWRAREEAQLQASVEQSIAMMEAMEPLMRDAMAELYAIYFTEEQLNDISAFYATPTGQVFATQSFAMSSDSRLYGRIMGSEDFWMAMAGMMEDVATLEPPPGRRDFADLSPEERRQLSALTGQSLEDIEAAMSWDYAAEDAMADDYIEIEVDGAMEEPE